MKRGTITVHVLENSETLGNIYDDQFRHLGKIENSKKNDVLYFTENTSEISYSSEVLYFIR